MLVVRYEVVVAAYGVPAGELLHKAFEKVSHLGSLAVGEDGLGGREPLVLGDEAQATVGGDWNHRRQHPISLGGSLDEALVPLLSREALAALAAAGPIQVLEEDHAV